MRTPTRARGTRGHAARGAAFRGARFLICERSLERSDYRIHLRSEYIFFALFAFLFFILYKAFCMLAFIWAGGIFSFSTFHTFDISRRFFAFFLQEIGTALLVLRFVWRLHLSNHRHRQHGVDRGWGARYTASASPVSRHTAHDTTLKPETPHSSVQTRTHTATPVHRSPLNVKVTSKAPTSQCSKSNQHN